MPHHDNPRIDLDPLDWNEFRRESHRALDEIINYVETIRDAPVWQSAPAEVLQQFTNDLPRQPNDLGEVLKIFNSSI